MKLQPADFLELKLSPEMFRKELFFERRASMAAQMAVIGVGISQKYCQKRCLSLSLTVAFGDMGGATGQDSHP
jgi:hypothetical protein